MVRFFNNLFFYLLMDIPVQQLFNRLYCAGVKGIFLKSNSSLSIFFPYSGIQACMLVNTLFQSIINTYRYKYTCTWLIKINPLKDPTICVILTVDLSYIEYFLLGYVPFFLKLHAVTQCQNIDRCKWNRRDHNMNNFIKHLCK